MSDLDDGVQILSGLQKALPGLGVLGNSEVGAQGWNVLREDLCFPVALLREAHLENNLRWMQRFIEAERVQLFPHGKTTMAPALFRRQLDKGCSGLTAASPTHMAVYCAAGVRRIVLANQVLGRANLEKLFTVLIAYPETELTLVVDSIDAVERLNAVAASLSFDRPINALIEVGAEGGRTGIRGDAGVIAMAEYMSTQSGPLRLVGIEAFEAVFHGEDGDFRAIELLDRVVDCYRLLRTSGLLAEGVHVLSAGGSAYYDCVSQKFNALRRELPEQTIEILLRSGCYVTHDDGMYVRALEAMSARNGDRFQNQLKPALEVWAVVQSLPEAGLGFANAGKRDLSYDVEMPIARYLYRPGQDKEPRCLSGELQVTGLNDQHAYLAFAPGFDIAIGDLIGFGISHPCTTFDKWSQLFVVDETYDVLDVVRTYF